MLKMEIYWFLRETRSFCGAWMMQITLERALHRMAGMKDKDARRSKGSAIRDVIPLRRVHRWDDCSRLPAPWGRWTTIEAQRWVFPLFQSAEIDSLKLLLVYLTVHVSIGEVSFIYLTLYVSIGDLFNGWFLYLFVKVALLTACNRDNLWFLRKTRII